MTLHFRLFFCNTRWKTVRLCELQFQKESVILGIFVQFSFWFKSMMSMRQYIFDSLKLDNFVSAVPEYLTYSHGKVWHEKF